ncbi:hypothetical protein TraAM80_03208 [Trypanosoma rangeli]|uniref:Calmodulin n=1 Tax=Trypanosoma rangeli TaxID=5698 RepID=A0A3R7KQI0_TRYRA|nr:uncharacterized protein TraAM80_03208 [Trypanosoma rangeli]RNF07686.1 hypothetical protein TraAM80_03208 [Trypanosoma rangeli]|eukprot:RNF07686.1 hypothetical protein TraAM80_03208 [Trypanosoma rangeli]
MAAVDEVLQKVRVRVAQRRLRLDDFFTDFDSLRSGRITANQLRRVLAVNSIQLADAEFEALKEAFLATNQPAGSRTPRGGDPTDVNYVAFLQALRAEDPPAELLTTLRRRGKPLSENEERTLATAFRALRDGVRARGLHLRKLFEDFDPFRSGKVAASRFRRCMPFEGLREDVLQLMLKKYSDDDGEVLYAAWCRDLEEDPASQEEGTHPASSSPQISPRGLSAPLSIDGLLNVLRSQFAMYRLRCDDVLKSYDHFRTGFVTAPQFASALGQLRFVNFHLTAEHIDTLTQAYADARLGGTGSDTNEEAFSRVNYVQFLANTNPRRDEGVPGSTTYYEMARTPGQFLSGVEDKEQERAEFVLNKVRRFVHSNRIHLIPTLHDFDRVRKGIYEHRTCTKSRFVRSLATNKIFLAPEEVSLLVKWYLIRNADGSPSDEVNYYQFVMDVDQAHKPELSPTRLLRSIGTGELQNQKGSSHSQLAETVPLVLVKVALQAEERRLRVNEFFIDFDPLRSGIVQTEKFAVALGIAGLHLHPQEVELLQKEYKSTKARDHIDVNRFVADVGEISPTVVPSVATKFNFSASRSLTGAVTAVLKDTQRNPFEGITDAERERLPQLLARLSHDVSTHHALLAPFFSDFDRLHRGKITKSNYLRALARHRFVLSAADTALLSRYYASPEDPELIEYTRFIRDIAQNEMPQGSGGEKGGTVKSIMNRTMTSTNNPASMGWNDTFPLGETVDEELVERILTKICCFLQERKARLSEFFPDGDELRHRHVTNTRFRHCLSILGLELSEEELQALEAAFAHSELRGHISYPAFFSTVSDKLQAGVGYMAVTQRRRGLGTATDTIAVPAADSAPEQFAELTAEGVSGTQKSTMTLAESQAELYRSAIDKVRRTLASRRSTSLQAFRQYDRARKGFVKEGQFFATLMSLGVQLTPAQSDAIRKAHSVGGGEIGYTKFCLMTDDERFA